MVYSIQVLDVPPDRDRIAQSFSDIFGVDLASVRAALDRLPATIFHGLSPSEFARVQPGLVELSRLGVVFRRTRADATRMGLAILLPAALRDGVVGSQNGEPTGVEEPTPEVAAPPPEPELAAPVRDSRASNPTPYLGIPSLKREEIPEELTRVPRRPEDAEPVPMVDGDYLVTAEELFAVGPLPGEQPGPPRSAPPPEQASFRVQLLVAPESLGEAEQEVCRSVLARHGADEPGPAASGPVTVMGRVSPQVAEEVSDALLSARIPVRVTREARG